MKLIEQLELLERVDRLIRLKATGSPVQLANKLGVSKRQVFRLILEMRKIGFPIAYNRSRSSYEYDKKIDWKLSVEVDSQNKLVIKGGSV